MDEKSTQNTWTTRIKNWLVLPAAVAGVIWAGVQFFYDRTITPRFEPAVIEISGAAVPVGSIDCCDLFNLEVVLQNTGRRNVHMHASHIAVGAIALHSSQSNANLSTESLNNVTLRRHYEFAQSTWAAASSGKYVGSPNDLTLGGVSRKTEDFLISAIGNLSTPGTELAPGEKLVRQVAVTVPKGYTQLSVRASVFAAHEALRESGLIWLWQVDPKTMALKTLPWESTAKPQFDALSRCATELLGDTGDSCRNKLNETGALNWKSFQNKDRYSYLSTLTWDGNIASIKSLEDPQVSKTKIKKRMSDGSR
jgi:hypothetical protein